MFPVTFLLFVLTIWSLASASNVDGQVRLGLNSAYQSEEVLDQKFSDHVLKLMNLWSIKGIAMTVVKPDGNVEYGTWGNRTEDGEAMTSNVLYLKSTFALALN